MKKNLCSNGFKVVLVLFLTMVVFCGALLLATYTVENFAFADDQYTFTQYIYSDPLPMVNNECWSFMGTTSLYPNYLRISRGFAYTNYDVTLSSGHLYALYYRFFAFGHPDYNFILPDGSVISRSYLYSLNSPLSYYDDAIFFTLNQDYTLYLEVETSNQSNSPFGISSFYLTDLSLTPFYTTFNSLSTANKVPYLYGQLGNFTKLYTTGVDYNNLASYSSDIIYQNGYDVGYDAGVLVSYDTGYIDGYYDGFGEGVILTRAQSYETSINNFQYGTSSYAYNSIGVLQPYDDGYHFLNIGWADMFPSATFNSLKKVGSFQVSCVMDLYTYTESLDTSVSPPAHTFSTPSLYQSDVLLKTNEVDFLANGERIICSCNFPFLDHPDISNNLLVEFIIEPHVTSLNFVDQYVYGDDVWPKTWFAVGAKNADTDYLYTFDIMPIDSSTSYEIGYDAGVNYADGRVNGSSASYAAGYNYGVESVGRFTFPSVIAAAIDVPVQTARNLLNFDFFGTNLNSFVLSLLSFGIVVAVVKLLLGR